VPFSKIIGTLAKAARYEKGLIENQYAKLEALQLTGVAVKLPKQYGNYGLIRLELLRGLLNA
jgi:hypothetical protein